MNQFDQAPVNGEAIEESIAIVCNGNTAPKAIAAGQYLFIKNHSTLATGGYHATDAIASGDTLSSSNVTSDPDGIANAINGKIPAVVNNLTSDSTTDALSASQGKALNSKKVFGMSKITASSLEDLKTKLISLADTMASETSTELVLVTTPAFDVFPNGTHSVTFHKLAPTYYWAYGFVANHIVTFTRAESNWTFSNDYNTLNSKITNKTTYGNADFVSSLQSVVNMASHAVKYGSMCSMNLYFRITSAVATGYTVLMTVPAALKPLQEEELYLYNYTDKKVYAGYFDTQGRICCREPLAVGDPYILQCSYPANY